MELNSIFTRINTLLTTATYSVTDSVSPMCLDIVSITSQCTQIVHLMTHENTSSPISQYIFCRTSSLPTSFGSLQTKMTPDFRSQVYSSVKSQMPQKEEATLCIIIFYEHIVFSSIKVIIEDLQKRVVNVSLNQIEKPPTRMPNNLKTIVVPEAPGKVNEQQIGERALCHSEANVRKLGRQGLGGELFSINPYLSHSEANVITMKKNLRGREVVGPPGSGRRAFLYKSLTSAIPKQMCSQ
ncbi:hypothetical protein J6590_078546 [Homalodisca vitripennis]|nr:hypothetical protein J6590_078546 [Homalodisca vitripennis]